MKLRFNRDSLSITVLNPWQYETVGGAIAAERKILQDHRLIATRVIRFSIMETLSFFVRDVPGLDDLIS